MHDVEVDYNYCRCVGELKRITAAAVPRFFTFIKPYHGAALRRASARVNRLAGDLVVLGAQE